MVEFVTPDPNVMSGLALDYYVWVRGVLPSSLRVVCLMSYPR